MRALVLLQWPLRYIIGSKILYFEYFFVCALWYCYSGHCGTLSVLKIQYFEYFFFACELVLYSGCAVVQKLDLSCLFWFPLSQASEDSVSNSQQYVCSVHIYSMLCSISIFHMVYCYSASCGQDL